MTILDCPPAARFALTAVADQINTLADQIGELERAIVTEAKRDEDMRRLTTIPGVGAITATTIKTLVLIPAGSNQPPLRCLVGVNTEAPFQRRQGAIGRDL